MNEKFEHKGYFFLPESPGIRIAGILSFLPGEKIFLEIFGSLNGDFGIGESLDLRSARIIQGDLSNSKKVTLFNCTVSFDYNLSSSFPLIRYSCKYLIVGGESGPDSRPIEEEWVLDIKAQCESQNVPFFFKQWGGKNKKKNGRLLQGAIYSEMPHLNQ